MDSQAKNSSEVADSAGAFGAQEIPLANGPDIANFDAFANSREDLKPQIEMPAELIDNDSSAEISGEMQPTEQPVAKNTQDDQKSDDEKKDEEVKAKLGEIKIQRDAESLPKAYEKAVQSIVERNRKDPFRLVQEMDIARWDMMGKAFSRKLGDGLNGTGA